MSNKQIIDDAITDAGTISKVTEGDTDVQVTSRTGRKIWTLSTLSRMIEQGFYRMFSTTALLMAYRPEYSPFAAKALDTKKVYVWESDAWVDTGLSDLDLAKDFANSNTLFKPGPLTIESNLNNFIDDALMFAATSNITSIDRNFPTNKGGIFESIKASASITYQKYTTHEEVFTRRFAGGDFSTWLRVPNTEWIDSMVKFMLSDYVEKEYLDKIDSRTINSNKPFPEKGLLRGGVVSNMNTDMSKFLLDIEVYGAREGKLYKVELFTNGSKQSGNSPYGWTISEYDEATFSDSTISDRLQVITARDNQEPVDRKSVGAIRLVSDIVSGLYFDITYDGESLPDFGTKLFRTSLPTDDGYSWVIDPICYKKLKQNNNSAQSFVFDSDSESILIDFKSGDTWYRWEFGKVGFNDLPNFKGIHKSTNGEDWIPINPSITDWLPPLRVAAKNNGDGKRKIATGGNHGNNGSAGGERTAKNILFQVYADGALLTEKTESSASTIDIVVVNDVMGWNTTPSETSSGRYIIRQSFNISFKSGSVEINAHNTALEDIQLARDSALQAVTSGFQNQMCFYNKSLREPYIINSSSGTKLDYPDVSGIGLFGNDSQFVLWLDRYYEAGKGGFLFPENPLVRTSGNKTYLAVVLDVNEEQVDIGTIVEFNSGESYKYRCGYGLQEYRPINGIDSAFIKHVNGKSVNTFVMSDGFISSV